MAEPNREAPDEVRSTPAPRYLKGGITPDPEHWTNKIILCSVNYRTTAPSDRSGHRQEGGKP